jgi:pyruvate kinase
MASTSANTLPAIRTKIVATVGPASREPAILRKLIDAGVNVFRLNFSHGSHEEHSAILADIRRIGREVDRQLAILQDLSGPKIRLGPIPGDLVECPLGEEFTLATDRTTEDPHELTCSYPNLPNDLKPGEMVLFADGAVAMTVTDIAPGQARLKVTLPGRLRSRQGLNLPGSDLNVKSLTEKDLQDLDWTARYADDVQYVGLSFARTPEDVVRLRRELEARNCPARVIVKIEKPQAVRNLEAIIAATDVVMVARGDLGVEMDVAQVPAIQKRIITLCNQAHRPVITATQMLNSMEHSNRPTRAEASDVFNAVLDGTDAVMLSGESAIGQYPVEAVATMRRICAEAETHTQLQQHRRTLDTLTSLAEFVHPVTEAMVDAAYLAAEQLNAPVIVVATASGRTALALSNRRPSAMILALNPTEQAARALTICWGVIPLVLPQVFSVDQELAFAVDWAKSHRLTHSGQHVVFIRGEMPGQIRSRAVLAHEVP